MTVSQSSWFVQPTAVGAEKETFSLEHDPLLAWQGYALVQKHKDLESPVG